MLAAWGFAHNSPFGLKQVGSTAATRRQPQAAALLDASNGGFNSAGSLRIVLDEAHIACGDVQPHNRIRGGQAALPIESTGARSARLALFIRDVCDRAGFPWQQWRLVQ
ncbi:hypothetical protein [Piscinibacter gummiphilus]|uniref:hypothetical protein n=1 Tax=Piscinibacter gummiphilus TaxID=946333 RepID=UPI0012F4B75F|nr:hypothetical protein [Piscinibacter gummiphilus]GLS98019.1 hypothetical protein GCM10007918_53110 [Piscinibacter gummiphilus]